jgi:hypothetical protein
VVSGTFVQSCTKAPCLSLMVVARLSNLGRRLSISISKTFIKL